MSYLPNLGTFHKVDSREITFAYLRSPVLEKQINWSKKSSERIISTPNATALLQIKACFPLVRISSIDPNQISESTMTHLATKCPNHLWRVKESITVRYKYQYWLAESSMFHHTMYLPPLTAFAAVLQGDISEARHTAVSLSTSTPLSRLHEV